MLLAIAMMAAAAKAAQAPIALAADERRLAAYVNEERQAEGLPPVALSPTLTHVARTHVRDLMRHRPDRGRCNMHSWSSAGDWTPVCFTADMAAARGMWNKPRELSRGAYRGYGFEIAFRMPGGVAPEDAMGGWLESPAHAKVMLEEGSWRGSNWQAMGVAIEGDYAVVWFGKEPDPAAAR